MASRFEGLGTAASQHDCLFPRHPFVHAAERMRVSPGSSDVPRGARKGTPLRTVQLSKFLIHVKSSLWFVPVLCVLAGVLLSFGTIALDRYFDYEALPGALVVGPDAAVVILTTIAGSMVSLAALVLTITMVVVQLAMGQFSPRIVQRILRDKPSQLAIGLFVATFVHSILAVREVVNNGDGTGQVPGISLLTAFLLVLVSIAVLVVYVHHIGQALRVSALIELVGKETRKPHRPQVPGRRPCSRDRAGITGGGCGSQVRSRHQDRLGAAGRGGAASRLRA